MIFLRTFATAYEKEVSSLQEKHCDKVLSTEFYQGSNQEDGALKLSLCMLNMWTLFIYY